MKVSCVCERDISLFFDTNQHCMGIAVEGTQQAVVKWCTLTQGAMITMTFYTGQFYSSVWNSKPSFLTDIVCSSCFA